MQQYQYVARLENLQSDRLVGRRDRRLTIRFCAITPRLTMRIQATLALLAASVVSGSAAAQSPHLTYLGVIGTKSCATFIRDRGNNAPGVGNVYYAPDGNIWFESSVLYSSFVEGYITVQNLMHSEHQQIMVDAAGEDLWLRRWCDANPTRQFVEAVSAFVTAHIPAQ